MAAIWLLRTMPLIGQSSHMTAVHTLAACRLKVGADVWRRYEFKMVYRDNLAADCPILPKFSTMVHSELHD